MTCLAVSGGVPPLLALAGGRLLSRKTGEIIPVPIIFSRVGFAEIPALRAVRGLGRRPIASLATPFQVAQPHLRCAALPIIGAPAGKTPVIAAGSSSHDISEERRVGKECDSTCRSRWSPYH